MTPVEIQTLFSQVAARLALEGWCLRSGGAPGADDAFDHGARLMEGDRQIFLPWPGFNKYPAGEATLEIPQPEAFEIAAQSHPVWYRLRRAARMLHARSVHQIYGPDVTNPEFSKFVVCWTHDGEYEGGTSQAMRISDRLNIPIINAGTEQGLRRLQLYLSRPEVEKRRLERKDGQPSMKGR